MYTEDQYKRAAAQVSKAPPEAQVILKQRMSEYERANDPHASQSAETRDAAPAPGEQLGAADLPPDTEALGVQPQLDTTRDASLPSASGLKTLHAPPEYTPKRSMATVAHIAKATLGDPLDGPSSTSFFEPTEQQFHKDMAPVLEAKGYQPGSSGYKEAFDEYRDRKWQQAYAAAAAEDRPLVRAAYVHQDHTGWNALKEAVRSAPDVLSAFAKGYASGATLHGTDALAGLSDAATGRDDVGNDREQAARNPIAHTLGEVAGSMRTGGGLAKITSGVGGLAEKYLPGALGRYAGAALGGAVAGEADLAARSGAQAIGDVAHGQGTQSAKDNFTTNILGSGLVGGAFGLGGQAIAEGATALQKGTVAAMPEVGQLRRGGGDTDALFGVKPGKDVAANIEAAREPIPGEVKPVLGATPTEVAASKVQGPLTEANATAHSGLRERIAAEREGLLGSNPKLQEPVPAGKTANAAVDWALSKLQPEAREGFLPGSKILSKDALPAADTSEAQKLGAQLWKPRLVTSVEAAAEARARGGKVITLEEARQLGIDTGPLKHVPDPETGVPVGAPPDVADSPVSIPDVLPRYSKADLANRGGAAADITPEESAAIQRYTFGKRNPEDAGIIDGYLERAPATQLPHVYRGMAMPAEQADALLKSGVYDSGATPVSVSTDPIVARSFAARNQNPGDVAITFKLEGAPARDIQPLAHSQVGVEKELLLPKGEKFDIVAKHRDPSNPDGWIVVARPRTEAAAGQVATPSPRATEARAAGLGDGDMRVVLEPGKFDAKTFETIVGDIDRKAKAGSATATPDPAWQQMQRAIREDRGQFGPEWSSMIARHHEALNKVEQRSVHAGIVEKKPYSEMAGASQQTLNGKLVGFPSSAATNSALRSLAADASPGVLKDLEVLGAQNAYSKLKNQANPRIGESVGVGSISGHLRGLGPAVRLRADAVARGLSRGPTGEPTISPRLIEYVKSKRPSRFLPGMMTTGGGALGMKAGVAYNAKESKGDPVGSLTSEQSEFLGQLLEAVNAAEKPKDGAAP